MCKNLRFNFVIQGRCSLKDKKSKAAEIRYEAPFLAGFIYFFDRMMPPHERRLSSAELSFQKLHLISTFSLWSILGSVEDLWKSDSAVSRKSITSGGHNGKKTWLHYSGFYENILYTLKECRQDLVPEVDEGRRKQVCSQMKRIGNNDCPH